MIDKRYYEFRGRVEDLDRLEKLLRHIEYLGKIGASRNLMVRVDGDGSGRVNIDKIFLDPKDILAGQKIDEETYNIDQSNLTNGCVSVYDIG